MAARMRAHDWSATPLGSPDGWPQSLRTTLRILLTTQFPMFIWWGPALVQLYNDAYRETMGPERHPTALGQPGRDCWEEIWPVIGPQIDHVMAGRGATWHEHQLIPVTRHGRREDVWWTYGYSPIEDEGRVGGVLVICKDVTAEHRAAEALLRANRRLAAESERLRALFDQAPGFMCVLRGPDHVFELVNASYVRLAGRTDVIGLPVRAAIPEIAGQGYFELLDRVYATGEPFVGRSIPIEMPGPGGAPEARFLDFVYQPIRDPDGRVTGIFVEGSDVTERTRVEAARQALAGQLADQRARLDTLIEHLPVGVNFLDRAGNSLVTNPAYRRFLPDGGIPSRLPQAASSWIGWDAAGRILEPAAFPGARALRGETVTGIEFLHRPGDGAPERWTRVSGVPLHDAAGRQTGALAVIVDIDVEKRTQEALRLLNQTLEQRVAGRTAQLQAMAAENRRLASVAENAPDFIGIFDLDLRVRYVNPAGRRLIGLTGETGRPVPTPLDYVVPDDRIRLQREVFPTVLADGHWAGELSFRHLGTGEPIPVLFDVFRIDDPATGVPLHFATVTLDLRERRRVEERIRQAQKMEAVGQLTGGLAHDFNNLLTAILGNLELVEARLGDDPTTRHMVQSAVQAAERGATLTEQLLAFSRRQHLTSQAVDLNRVVAELSDMLARTLGGETELRTALGEGLWPALVDKAQIEVAVLNLAINARDAMPGGGPLLVGTRNVAAAAAGRPDDLPPGDHVAVAVTDGGAGMTPEVAAHAFEPFFTTKEVGKGTGLGLSQVYGLARQSGGTARIASRPGRGTTVEIFLPRAAADAPVAAPVEPSGPPAPDRPRLGTVLVLDDQDTVREVAAAQLEALGYHALPVSTGPALLALLRAGGATPAALLVDYAMPGMAGPEVIARARDAWPGLPVVLMTGYAEAGALAATLPVDVVLLKKPFNRRELAAALDATGSRD